MNERVHVQPDPIHPQNALKLLEIWKEDVHEAFHPTIDQSMSYLRKKKISEILQTKTANITPDSHKKWYPDISNGKV